MRKSTVALASLALSGSLVLTACGGGDDDSMSEMSGMDSSSTPSSSGGEHSGDFNQADVTFATEMIQHHRQAVEMADLAEGRAKSAPVSDLAAKIKAAQDPEIRTMSSWLKTWGEPVPEDMSGMDMGGSMPGMMSAADMSELKNASGAEFDTMFLKMMVAHHKGAIEMANSEQTDGTNKDAQALAQQIEKAQTAEVAKMQGLLRE